MVFDILYMLDGVDNFVDELEGYPGDDSLGVCERSLECTQGNPRFLCRDAGEKL